MSRFSDELYNPFILPVLQKAGYVKSMVAAHSLDEVDDHSGRKLVSPTELKIGDDWAQIPYGTAIDLGGCGKGYIGDILADFADSFKNVSGYWFSLGGDIVTGGFNEDGQPWVVGAALASQGQLKPDAQFKLPDPSHYAVATSSIASRKGVKNGKAWHHIIDPRTGQPSSSDIVATTVCARQALEADILASCAIILGSQTAPQFLKSKKVLGYLYQTKDKQTHHWGKFVKAL